MESTYRELATAAILAAICLLAVYLVATGAFSLDGAMDLALKCRH